MLIILNVYPEIRTRFTTGYVRLVGQEPAPGKCVLLSTSREVFFFFEYFSGGSEGDEGLVTFSGW